jgi:hypothetical protein
MKLLPGKTDQGSGPAQRFERKFFVLPRNLGFAYMFLKQICRPDGEYPADEVTSLYFDTPDLDQYLRSVSGDFKKDKVRIRWYGSTLDHGGLSPVYLEVKSREGFASSKQRRKLMVPSGLLERPRMGEGIINKSVLAETLAGFKKYQESPLKPVIVISYWRYRFTELLTGTRIAFDQNIRSYMVFPGLGFGERELKLQGGVIEVKGTSVELPLTMRRINMLVTDWTRFSKYGNSLESHLQYPGTVGRLWPSGRTGLQ